MADILFLKIWLAGFYFLGWLHHANIVTKETFLKMMLYIGARVSGRKMSSSEKNGVPHHSYSRWWTHQQVSKFARERYIKTVVVLVATRN